jgi:hypothetical protein
MNISQQDILQSVNLCRDFFEISCKSKEINNDNITNKYQREHSKVIKS